MKNIKKISLGFVLAFCFALIISLTSAAERSYPRVVDGADLLSTSEEDYLLAKLDGLSTEHKLDIAIVTVDHLSVGDTAFYARNLYEEYGYGQGDDYSGILLFIYFDSVGGGYEIVTSGKAKSIFNDFDLDSLENAIYDYLSYDEFYEAFCAFADECEYIIATDGKLSPIWILIALIAGAVTAGLILWSMISKHNGVKAQRSADSYMMRDTFRLERSRDVYLYSHVTRVVKPQNNSSGGGRSSSGRSYGGRSGRF